MIELAGELVKVVDGDTWHLRVTREIYCGFGLTDRKTWLAKFRLAGFDCPEVVGAERAAGLRAKAEAAALLERIARVVSHDKMHGDRWLADVYVFVEGAERSLGEVLFERGLATLYP